MSKAYISNKDKLITSNYWQTLIPLLGTKFKLSTAFHPQTDGQTEQMNQSLETYLQHYVNKNQTNWVLFLPLAQLALNARKSDTTKESPFFANFRKDPNLFLLRIVTDWILTNQLTNRFTNHSTILRANLAYSTSCTLATH